MRKRYRKELSKQKTEHVELGKRRYSASNNAIRSNKFDALHKMTGSRKRRKVNDGDVLVLNDNEDDDSLDLTNVGITPSSESVAVPVNDENVENVENENVEEYVQVLTDWNLVQYAAKFLEFGWDAPNEWHLMKERDLKDMEIPRGHIRRFEDKMKGSSYDRSDKSEK